MKIGSRRYFDTLSTDGVERAEANGPPSAFRIWKQGSNVTDHGPTVFSKRSAALLLKEQATRGNRFSIDVDHMSLDKSAPLENHQAVGWFSLAVRDGDLWAVDIEWVNDTIRSGLTKGAWKYMSPAYDVNDDGEVVSFLNLSLTANPATHATTALASRGAPQKDNLRMAAKDAKAMKWSALKAAIDGDDEDAKASAYATIAAAFPDSDETEKDAEEAPPESKKGEPEKDSEEEPEKKDSKSSDDEPEKKDAIADAVKAAVKAALAPFVRANEASERKTLLASRPDFSPELVAVLSKAPLATVRDSVAKLPRTAVKVVSTESVQATRGEGTGVGTASRLSPTEKAKIDERMGLKRRVDGIKHEGIHSTFGALTREDAAAILAKKTGAK